MLDTVGLDLSVDAVEVIFGHEKRVVLRCEVDSGLGELEEDAVIKARDEEESAGLRRWKTVRHAACPTNTADLGTARPSANSTPYN
ncbi:MAG: hypothetical protein ACRDSR_12080 [Pseudonocardiaceae bacterium]